MMAPPEGRRNVELLTSWQSYAGVQIRSIGLPPPYQQLEKFWSKLWIEQDFPILFPPTVLAAIEKSFVNHQVSSNCTLRKFQHALACYFTQRGSFLAVATNQNILAELWQIIAWFLVDGDARGLPIGERNTDVTSYEMLQALEELETRQQIGQLILKLMQPVRRTAKNSVPTLFHPTCSLALHRIKRKEFLEHLWKMREQINNSRDEVSSKLCRCRTLLLQYAKCDSTESAIAHSVSLGTRQIEMQQDVLNELIVLVGKCRDGDALGEIEEHMDGILSRWVFQRSNNTQSSEPQGRELSSPQQFGWEWSSDPPEYDWGAIADSLSPESRSATVRTLLFGQQLVSKENIASSIHHLSLPNIAGTMYRLIRDIVVTSQEEWYEEFWECEIVPCAGGEENFSREMSYDLFSVGLRYLKQCGMISEKLPVGGSKSDVVCERVKLVWCGADF